MSKLFFHVLIRASLLFLFSGFLWSSQLWAQQCFHGYFECVRASICNTKLALTSAGYIRTAVNLSCHGNLGTTSGKWSDQNRVRDVLSERRESTDRMHTDMKKERWAGVRGQQHMTSIFYDYWGENSDFCVVISCIPVSFLFSGPRGSWIHDELNRRLHTDSAHEVHRDTNSRVTELLWILVLIWIFFISLQGSTCPQRRSR